MEQSVCGDSRIPVETGFPLQIRKTPARLGEDGDEGCGIPRTENGIDHDLGSAGGHQNVSVTISPRSSQRAFPNQFLPTRGCWALQEFPWIGGESSRVG